MRIKRRSFLRLFSAAFLGLGMKSGIKIKEKSTISGTKTVELGRSNLHVTPLGFGAARIQEPGLLKAALDSGMNFIDTGTWFFYTQ